MDKLEGLIEAVAGHKRGDVAAAMGRALAREDFGPPLTQVQLAHLVAQAAHESGGFARLVENLNYTTPERIRDVWPSRFRTVDDAMPFLRNAQKLAEKVYGFRADLGNKEPGDGWRFRGRGWLQLTGRANYKRAGAALDLDLLKHPELAADPEVAWRIAIWYMRTRKRGGKTAFEWAEEGSVDMVTKVVNGGTAGLSDRLHRTVRAAEYLDNETMRLAPVVVAEPQPEPSNGFARVVQYLLGLLGQLLVKR